MKKKVTIIVMFFIIQSTIGAGKGPKHFNNINVSEEIVLEQVSNNNLLLKHKYLSEPFNIITDGVYVYLKYKGEVMGQFLNKYEYTIIPKKDRIDILVEKKNGKTVSKYYIEEKEQQVHIAEVIR